MRLGAYDFRPGGLPTLITLVLLAFLIGLGVWQLDRAEQKRSLLAQWQQRRDAPPQALESVLSGNAERFTRVVARGKFDDDHQFLLDNRIQNNRPGFHVLTPLKLANGDGAILVNRGWVPMGEGRSDLPEVPAPEGAVRVVGGLASSPQTGIRMGPADRGDQSWPKIVQHVEPKRIRKQLGYPVRSQVIRLDPDASGGFQRDWGASVPFGPERHLGYAFQWFALAATLLVIYVAVNIKRRKDKHGIPHGE
ncbi:SURF1 family protein [Thiohalorhabdus sp.]|uniref:SURF1 family protein n=1 Tax=Thiohalorhabdus sp. TaxID=3094134 RepID=UPI002FC37C07